MTHSFKPEQAIESYVKSHELSFRDTFLPGQIQILAKIAEMIANALKGGHKILLCGNGGSGADAQHIPAEFTGRVRIERRGLPAISLTTDTSAITAIGNDYSFEQIFARQVEALGQKGDVLIAISTSGNSKNVIGAAKLSKSKGITVIGFTGKSGGQLKNLVDINFSAAADSAAFIQEMHITALHAICDVTDQLLFPQVS